MSTAAGDAAARIEIIRLADTLSDDELDALPVGAIQLAPDGTVLRYNETESSLSRLAKEDVVGRNFFTEVAPCTRVRDFHGRFAEGVEAGFLDVTFAYRFRFSDDRRKDVTITLSHRGGGNVWVLVERP